LAEDGTGGEGAGAGALGAVAGADVVGGGLGGWTGADGEMASSAKAAAVAMAVTSATADNNDLIIATSLTASLRIHIIASDKRGFGLRVPAMFFLIRVGNPLREITLKWTVSGW
jgi:hypothetical protein